MPGLDPRWSRRVEADDADGVRRAWHVLDNGARAGARHPALRPRQPDLVLPVARASSPRRRPAGGWSRSTSSAWAGPSARAAADPGPAGRRPRRPHRRPGHHRPRGDRRPRLGRPGVARLGAGAPRPAARRRPDQHGGAPAGRRRRALADPAGPHAGPAPGCSASRTPAFVRTTSALSRPPPAGGGPRRARRALRARRPGVQAVGRLRRRHPAGPGPPERRAAGPDRGRPGRPRRRAGRCCCGARATRSSPTSTCATCSAGCRTPRCTGTRVRRTWSPRTHPRAAGDVWRWIADLQGPTAVPGPAGGRPAAPRCGPALTARAGDPTPRPWSSWAGAHRQRLVRPAGPPGARPRGRAWPRPGCARATGSRCSCRPAPT